MPINPRWTDSQTGIQHASLIRKFFLLIKTPLRIHCRKIFFNCDNRMMPKESDDKAGYIHPAISREMQAAMNSVRAMKPFMEKKDISMRERSRGLTMRC